MKCEKCGQEVEKTEISALDVTPKKKGKLFGDPVAEVQW